jgi:hypothetical protein
MLGNLSISVWTAKVAAKGVARDAESKAKAKTGTFTASKKLADGVLELEAITKKATAIRNDWAKRSVPWFDNGPRGYNALHHFDILQQVSDWGRDFEGLTEEFYRVYPMMVANKMFDLGDSYNSNDFPPLSVLRGKFAFRFDTSTVPNTDDIRVVKGIPSEQVDTLIDAAVDNERHKVQSALSDAATKLYEKVEAIHQKLSVPIGDSGSIFRNSMLENLTEMVELMPVLNITGDPALAKLAAQAKKLTLYSAADLREDAVAREQAAKQAQYLAKKLQGMFGSEDE